MGRYKSLVLWSCVLVILAAAAGPVAAADQEYRFKMATLAPKGIGWAQAWSDILEPGISRASDGNVTVKVYYGGIMGDEEDYVKKMRIGQLDAGAITGQGATLACPELTAVELPFLFRNYDEVDYVRERMYPVFDKYAQEAGFKLLYWFEQDFDQIYSVNWPLDSLEQFRKARFLTWYGELEHEVLEALGVSPVPINAPEVPSALRQKVVDSLIAPSVWVVGSQTYSVIRYVNRMKIRYAPGIMVFSNDAWDTLPPDYQKRIVATRDVELEEFIDTTRSENEKALAALIKYGLVDVQMDPKVVDEMKTRTRPVWDELAGKAYPRAVLDQIIAHLEEYRKQHPGE